MACPSCGNTESVQKAVGPHTGEYCASCGKWFRWISQGWEKFIWPVGTKHKGETLISILINDRGYLEWAAENMSGTLQKRAKEALNSTGPQDNPSKDSGEEDTVDRLSRHFKPREEPFDSDGSLLPW